MKINVKEMSLINDLVQVNSTKDENKIKNYIIEVSKEDGCLYVEEYQPQGLFAVCIKKPLDKVEKNEKIPISDPKKFKEILKLIDGKEEIELKCVNNKVKISKYKMEMPTYVQHEDEINANNNLRETFENRDYGDPENKLVGIGEESGKEKPDATCDIDLSKINAKKTREIFSDGVVNLKIEKNKLHFVVEGKSGYKIDKDIQCETSGVASVFIDTMDCFSMLTGDVRIEFRENLPLVIKKKDEKISMCYLLSLLTTEEDEEEE